MTIGNVSEATGIPASTIRYYEAVGIIRKVPRKNGVRQYGADAVDELKALRLYRESGITIRGLKAIGMHPRATSARNAVWADVVRARIGDLDAWIQEAKVTKELLERVLACRCSGKRERCRVVHAADALRHRSSTARRGSDQRAAGDRALEREHEPA